MSHALQPAQIIALTQKDRLPTLARLAVGFAVAVTAWDHRRHTRKALGKLDPYLLHDIGLSHPDAQAEMHKPFWRD